MPLTRGRNTIVATVASNAGGTAKASERVTYAPAPRVGLKGQPKFNGHGVPVKLACASSGSNCKGAITLRYTGTVVKHHTTQKVALVVGTKSYSPSAGSTATIQVTLNGKGLKLLRALGKLGVEGTVTVIEGNGHATSAATFKLTLKPPDNHHK